MILYIHSNASYLSVSEGRSLTVGFFFLGTQPQDPTKPTTVLPDPNGPLYVEWSIMRRLMALAMESKLGALFTNGPKAVPIWTTLIEMDHPQPSTPIISDNP